MGTLKKYIPEIWFLAFVFLLNTYRLFSTSNFNPDLGRDLMWIWDVLHGNLTLLGPKLSFGGYYLGPYYYYIFAPFVFLSHYLPYGLVASNAVISALFSTVIFYILKKHHGTVFAGLSTLWICIAPYFLFSARNPGNAYSYISALFLLSIIYLYTRKSRFFYIVMGLASGLIINFHPASVFLLAPFVLWSFEKVSVKEALIRIGLYCFSAALLFAPMVLFEVRHHFIMFTNTFITKSYSTFLSASSPATMMKASPNFINSFFQIDTFLSRWLSPSIAGIFTLSAILAFLSQDTKAKRGLFLMITVLILFNFALRYQVAFHYAFPLLIAVQCICIYILGRLRVFVWYPVLLGIVILSILNFPRENYAPAYRPFEKLYSRSEVALRQMPLKRYRLNVAYFAHNPLATLGYEYRYILKLLGYTVMGEQEYINSDRLLIISEEGEVNFQTLHTWELDQFGSKKLIASKSVDGILFHLFGKLKQ